ncbi:MAG TPA: hypothetical protein VEI98_16615 [Xanthobacteraceae bacterium]|nr:hypothetical protein [Xanthobacteraceae bacterium]
MFGKTDQKRSEGEDTVLPRARGGLIAAIVGGFLLFMAGGATALLLGPGDWKSRRDGVVNPDAFTDGIGIYLLNDGKYNLLVWKKKIVATPGTAPDPKDIAEASREAIAVGPGTRFFTYSLDVATWPVVPPYEMAFCIVRDEKTIDGIYPIRLKLLDREHGPIYEMLLPPIVENLKSGALPHLFWVLNYQYSCNDGWTFRFARGR